MEEKGTRPKLASRLSGHFASGVSRMTEPLVVLRGQREATVYGCRKILLYTPPEIRLCMRRKKLCILGEGLCCTSFSGGTVTVEGRIAAIRYAGETEDGNET